MGSVRPSLLLVVSRPLWAPGCEAPPPVSGSASHGLLAASAGWLSDASDPSQDLAWGDLDGDGDLDIAVGTSAGLQVFENDGGLPGVLPDGTWSAAGSVTGLAWGDWDGDGDLDLAVSNTGAHQRGATPRGVPPRGHCPLGPPRGHCPCCHPAPGVRPRALSRDLVDIVLSGPHPPAG